MKYFMKYFHEIFQCKKFHEILHHYPRQYSTKLKYDVFDLVTRPVSHSLKLLDLARLVNFVAG